MNSYPKIMGAVIALTLTAAITGCATMSPELVAQLPTDELCVDHAEAIIQNGRALNGADIDDINKQLESRGANCTDNDFNLAQTRIQQYRAQQQVEAQNMTQGLINAAAIYQATHPQPVYQRPLVCDVDKYGYGVCQ